jgi:hypothetical protein
MEREVRSENYRWQLPWWIYTLIVVAIFVIARLYL